MASQGKTDKIGSHETVEAAAGVEQHKDFKGSKVEGKKDETDGPVTCEAVIASLRQRNYRI